MERPTRTFEDKVKTLGGALSALLGILTFVPQFKQSLIQAFEALGLPSTTWWGVAVVLLLAGAVVLRESLRRSRFLRPEALFLRAHDPAHLKGRDEDIHLLVALCHEYQQIHLLGESGAGKTALIQAGLCPALQAQRGVLPIYQGVWGHDWQAGPYTALRDAFWAALSADDCQALGLVELPQPEAVVKLFEQVRTHLGSTPLVIFDQFDDYQIRHRAEFLPGRRRTWVPVAQLIEANAFWRDIAALVQQRIIHCLFVTRNDTAGGLESVRFVTPRVYQLDRLQGESILPFLTELTAPAGSVAPVVYAPERGWERLKIRLARDLSQERAVLPVQLKLALQGLASLKALTVREYDRAGGLHGLIAAHVERHVAHTARSVPLTQSQIRALLLLPTNAATLKTLPKSFTDFLAVISPNTPLTARLEAAVQQALENLETKELLRKRLDPDTRQPVWLLDHDYLCHGVLEAERRANRWAVLARERYRVFQETGGSVWRKWRTLLNPWQQIGLCIQRVRGRFRYGELRPYALWSLLRFAPALLVVLLLAGVGGWYWDAYQRAHVEYYAQVLTRWGLPEGVGRLTAEQVRQRNASLAFHKHGRRGPVHEIRLVNSRGAYPPVFCTHWFP